MKSITEMAKALGVNRQTLAVRLWHLALSRPDKFKPKRVEVKGVLRNLYTPEQERELKQYLKTIPKPGRPMKAPTPEA